MDLFFSSKYLVNTSCISWIKVDPTVKLLFYVHIWEFHEIQQPMASSTSKSFYHRGIMWSFWRNRFENCWSLVNFIRTALENTIYLHKSWLFEKDSWKPFLYLINIFNGRGIWNSLSASRPNHTSCIKFYITHFI